MCAARRLTLSHAAERQVLKMRRVQRSPAALRLTSVLLLFCLCAGAAGGIGARAQLLGGLTQTLTQATGALVSPLVKVSPDLLGLVRLARPGERVRVVLQADNPLGLALATDAPHARRAHRPHLPQPQHARGRAARGQRPDFGRQYARLVRLARPPGASARPPLADDGGRRARARPRRRGARRHGRRHRRAGSGV